MNSSLEELKKKERTISLTLVALIVAVSIAATIFVLLIISDF